MMRLKTITDNNVNGQRNYVDRKPECRMTTTRTTLTMRNQFATRMIPSLIGLDLCTNRSIQ
jgi:hypothetical protein